MSCRICVVSTVHEPPQVIDSFIRYHVASGISQLFLFFDQPADPAIGVATKYPQVTAIPSDDALRARQRRNRVYGRVAPFVAEIQGRQILNAETAVSLALDMEMDWILHIDADELLYSPVALEELFGDVPAHVGQLAFRNFEGVPESVATTDYFSEVTLFKRHPSLLSENILKDYRQFRPRRFYFLGYGNGKAAARVVPGLEPLGVHRFALTKTCSQTIEFADLAIILHYINCGLSAYIRKHERLPADRWLGVPIPHEFYIESRRLADSHQALRELYEREVLFDDPVENDYLLGRGILTRIALPARTLRTAGKGD